MAFTTNEKWNYGIALGVMGAIVGMAVFVRGSYSRSKSGFPVPAFKGLEDSDYQLESLRFLEYRMKSLQKQSSDLSSRKARMNVLRESYIAKYREAYGEDPQPDDLKKLTGGF